MQKQMQQPSRRKMPSLGIFFLLGMILLAACNTIALPSEMIPETIPGEIQTVARSKADVASPSSQEVEAYDTVMSVLTHPRCSNCHPTDDRPRQRDDQRIHFLNVTRGESNHGGPVQTCETCHHEENNPYSQVPGAPHWGLAPKSMGWIGLSHAEIAETLLDPAKNGNRTAEDLMEHMRKDALVLWGWEPGGDREPVPVPHDEFLEALEIWLDAGAPIPGE